MRKAKLYAVLTFIVMLVATLTSCEKFALEESSTNSHEANANVTIHVQEIQGTSLSPATKATDNNVTLGQICSRLTFAVFDGDEKLGATNQESTDANFGTAHFNLDEGDYTLVVIAHSGKGNCTISNPEKVKFANNKLTDTFYYYGTLSVNEEGATTEIKLQRAVGALHLHIDGTIPDTIKSIKFYYLGGSSTLDAASGYGNVNSRQTEEFSIQDDVRDYTVYTFPHEEEKYIKMTISLLDTKGEVVKSYQKIDLKLKRNNITNATITLDGSEITEDDSEKGDKEKPGIQITFDPSWETAEEVDFG